MLRRLAAAAVLLAAVALAAPAVPARAEADQVVPGSRIVEVTDKIAHDLVTGDDKAVVPAFQMQDQHLPTGSVTIAAGGTPFVSSTYVSVPVALIVDGKLVRRLVAGYRVVRYVTTAVAAHDLTPGTVIGEGDVMLQRVASIGRPGVEIEALEGRKITVAVAKGAPLYMEETIPDTIVRAGQPAILIVHDGPVALSADVVARTGGALGDTVTVWNPDTRRALAGVVTGPNRVELTLGGS